MKLSFQTFFLLIVTLIFIQKGHASSPDEKFNKKKYLKAADEALKQGSIFSATDLYLEILKQDSNEKSVLFNLAQSYFLARDYENAAKYFRMSYEADTVSNTFSLYYAALTTKMNGRYEEAIPMFKRFAKQYKDADAVKLKKWAKTEIDGCYFALKESQPDPYVKLIHLGKEVNSNYGDLAPALRDDALYFASINSDTVLWMNQDLSDSKKENVLMKLYFSKLNGEVYKQKEQVTAFNQKGKHISNPSFSPDGKKMFYTICDGGLLKTECAIYMSEMKGTEWSEGKSLNSEINLSGSTNTQPFYASSSTGTEALYFVSNREGGKGGTDVWISVVNKKGEFTTPKNLGAKINTDRDEVTPFYDAATNTLFFSSNGWISMGGADIYKSQSDGLGKFNSNPENLGAPFNSCCDDNYFRYGKNSENGYLVSNREGIYSVRGRTCCYDIFNFRYDRRINVAVKGRVIDEATNAFVTGATVHLSLRSDNSSENDLIINTDTSHGVVPFFYNLKADKLYKLTAVKDGYFTSSQNFDTRQITRSDTLTVDIYLKKLEKDKAYRLNNIYYDFDKWDLRTESKATLDTLYNILIENPTIIIELSSHTDIRGSEVYNLTLSQRRAESCVNYLINERGISKDRVTAKGYGEQQTLEDCSKLEECPQDQSGDCACHQLNRRTEFKITGELDGKLFYED